MYRNGKSDDTWYFKFADMIDEIKISNHEIILLRDFNINLFEQHHFWESTISISGNQVSKGRLILRRRPPGL